MLLLRKRVFKSVRSGLLQQWVHLKVERHIARTCYRWKYPSTEVWSSSRSSKTLMWVQGQSPSLKSYGQLPFLTENFTWNVHTFVHADKQERLLTRLLPKLLSDCDTVTWLDRVCEAHTNIRSVASLSRQSLPRYHKFNDLSSQLLEQHTTRCQIITNTCR